MQWWCCLPDPTAVHPNSQETFCTRATEWTWWCPLTLPRQSGPGQQCCRRWRRRRWWGGLASGNLMIYQMMHTFYYTMYFTHIHAIISHTHITHAPRVLINVVSTYAGNGRLVAFLLPLLYFFAWNEVNDDFDQSEYNQAKEDDTAQDWARHHPRVWWLGAHWTINKMHTHNHTFN